MKLQLYLNGFLTVLFSLIAQHYLQAEVITVKALHKACNPNALIPQCGKNAICARIPRCQLGVCICRLDGNYLPSLRNNFDCEEPPRQPTMCELLQLEINNRQLTNQGLNVKRSLCGDDDGYNNKLPPKSTDSPLKSKFPVQHGPTSNRQKVASENRAQSSGKLLDRNEDCSRQGSKCNAHKGLTCDSQVRRCHCQWPNLQKADGACYLAGYGEACSHDHECDWMYRGTAAGLSGTNAVCDDATSKCRCNTGYQAVPRVSVNYFLPVQKQTGPIDVSVYNVSVLLSTANGNNAKTENVPLETTFICLKESVSSKSRVALGGSCSYLATMVNEPVLCGAGLVCQYCPVEDETNNYQSQIMGTCVKIDSTDETVASAEKTITKYSEDVDSMARILIAVGVVLATVIISVAAFLFWRRHQHRMRSLNSSMRSVRCQRYEVTNKHDPNDGQPLQSSAFPFIGDVIHQSSDSQQLQHVQQQHEQEQINQPQLQLQQQFPVQFDETATSLIPTIDDRHSTASSRHTKQSRQSKRSKQSKQSKQSAHTVTLEQASQSMTEQPPLASRDPSEVSRV